MAEQNPELVLDIGSDPTRGPNIILWSRKAWHCRNQRWRIDGQTGIIVSEDGRFLDVDWSNEKVLGTTPGDGCPQEWEVTPLRTARSQNVPPPQSSWNIQAPPPHQLPSGWGQEPPPYQPPSSWGPAPPAYQAPSSWGPAPPPYQGYQSALSRQQPQPSETRPQPPGFSHRGAVAQHQTCGGNGISIRDQREGPQSRAIPQSDLGDFDWFPPQLG
jgi:hypothetical protein